MTYVKIDDRITEHPKVLAAGPLALAMQVAGLCYCNRELTDGFIPRAKARSLLDWQFIRSDGKVFMIGVACGMQGIDVDCQWVIDLLVECGIWEIGDGGYHIHDYSDYQSTKSEVEEYRAKKVAGGQASAKARARTPVGTPVGTGSQLTTTSNSSLSEDPPLPPKGEPKRAFRLPDDWQPNVDSLIEKGYTESEVAIEAENFKNRQAHKRETGFDWNRAFLNWMKKSREFRPPTPFPTNGKAKYVAPVGKNYDDFTDEERAAYIAHRQEVAKAALI